MPASSYSIQILAIVMAVALAASGAAGAAPEGEPEDAARSAIAQMTPHEVGSRYGQALGAVEICRGVQTTAKVPALNAVYSGADLETFKAQARKIYDAWIRLKQCAIAEDPSECRVVIEESCAAAITDIGPKGGVFPGLLDRMFR